MKKLILICILPALATILSSCAEEGPTTTTTTTTRQTTVSPTVAQPAPVPSGMGMGGRGGY